MPEGYELTDVTVTERTQTEAEITYRDGDDELRVLVRNEPYDLERGISTEIGGQNATVVQGYPDPFVRWNCGDTGYAVGGSADQEVWLAVAESIGCGGS